MIDSEEPAIQARPGKRRLVIGAVVLVLVATLGVSGWLFDRRYGPPEAGSFGGMVSLDRFASSDDDGSHRLTADGGQLLASLRNTGSHAITISWISSDETVSNIAWSQYSVVPGGDLTGQPRPWRNFPASIPAHGTIRLLVTVRRPPECASLAPGTSMMFGGQYTVHWRSWLFRHSTTVSTLLLGNTSIQIC